MERIKTFAKYAIWIILFWIFADILIYFAINTTYKDIEEYNQIPNQITVSRAEATKVNGRINGVITNNEQNNISEKYIKIDVYSKNDNLLGTTYLDIGKLGTNESKNFETYFKIQDVKKYNMTITDQKEELPEFELDKFISEDIKTIGIIFLLARLIFI